MKNLISKELRYGSCYLLTYALTDIVVVALAVHCGSMYTIVSDSWAEVVRPVLMYIFLGQVFGVAI